jgi:hypothetical protein
MFLKVVATCVRTQLVIASERWSQADAQEGAQSISEQIR